MDNNDFSSKKRNTINTINNKDNILNHDEVAQKLNFISSPSENFISNKDNINNFLNKAGIEIIKNYKKNFNSQNTFESLVHGEPMNPMQLRLNNFEKFIKDIKSGMSKCKYRKTLEDILMREDIFIDLEIFWRIRELKIKCMLKILEKKIFKSDASQNQKLKSIDMWSFKIETEIEVWIGSLSGIRSSDNNDYHEEQIETLIHIILEEFNLQAQYKFSLKQYPESIAILGISEKIMKICCEFSRSVKLLQSSQKITLFISSLLISDNDYTTAKIYQNNAIKLAFKELFLRSDLEDGIHYDNISKTNQHYLNKIFLNLIKAFYHRGVCDENLGNLPEAIDSYKQAIWFSNSFVKFQYPEISQFLADVEMRAKDYHNLIKKMLEKFDSSDHFFNKQKNKRNFTEETEQNLMLSPFSMKNSEKKSKKGRDNLAESEDDYKRILDGIKHQEFEFLEDDKKSENVKQIMSTVNLLNNFSSKKFRDLVKIMPQMSLENIDKVLVDKIQKRLNDIRAEQKFTEMEKKRADLKNKNRAIESNNLKAELEQYLNKDGKIEQGNMALNNINFEKNYKISLNMFLSTEKFLSDRNTEATSPNSIGKKSKNMGTTINLTIEGNRNKTKENNSVQTTSRKRPMSHRISKDPAKKIEKYLHDEYIFSADFQKKTQNIDEMVRKETDFQKKLLRLKKYEKLPLEIKEIDVNGIKEEAKNFFERARSAYKSGFTFPNENQAKKSTTLKDIEKNKKEKYKQRLEVALIKSLDTKVFGILDNIKKMEEKNDNVIRDEFLNLNKNNIEKISHEKINSDYTRKLEKDLSFLQKKENMCRKIIEQDNKKMKAYLKNKSRSKNANILTLNNVTDPIYNTFNRASTAKTAGFRDKYYSNDSSNNEEKKFGNLILKNKNLKDFNVDLFVIGSKLTDKKDSFCPTPLEGRNSANLNIDFKSINSNYEING